MNNTDKILASFMNSPEHKETITKLTAAVISAQIVHGCTEDEVLGVVIALVKSSLVTKECRDAKERLERLNDALSDFFKH